MTFLGLGLPTWAREAACKNDPDPDRFFNDAQKEQAREVCESCPVREACLEEFRTDPWAFAGGYSANERRYMRRKGLL